MPLSALGSLGTAACAIEGWGEVVVFGCQHTPFLLLKNMWQGLGGGTFSCLLIEDSGEPGTQHDRRSPALLTSPVTQSVSLVPSWAGRGV